MRTLMVVLAVAAMPIAAAFASLSPASLFQDGAVLQRDMPVPVWGRCDPTPFSPPSGQATGSFNGLHTESKFLAAFIAASFSEKMGFQ